jgi:glycerophosphoryl diester phosphodiesterase
VIPDRPLVIAHRGASGHRPEHTLEAYELAIRLGADYIEPDVVITRDGVLVARHENELSTTTDVASRPALAGRRTTKRIDGRDVTGWFCEDFTLEELRTLRVRERLPFRSPAFDGRYPIPTLQETVDLARDWSSRLGRTVGIYPETKHPTYFESIALPLEPRLLELLEANGYRGPQAPVFIQSLEIGNLEKLRRMTELPLVQLLEEGHLRPFDLAASGDPRTFEDLTRPAELERIASYANAIGCHKRLIVPAGPDGRLRPPTTLLRDAHAAGLRVHAWTFRSEPVFLAPDYEGAPEREYEQFLALGLDGVFTDFPGTAVAVREELSARKGNR